MQIWKLKQKNNYPSETILKGFRNFPNKQWGVATPCLIDEILLCCTPFVFFEVMKGADMEFLSLDQWRVQKKFNLNEKELNSIICRMKKRHPLEKWLIIRIAENGERVVYFKLEFVDWIETVFLNKSKHYLDLEIAFFSKHIKRLEDELNISARDFEYQDMSLEDLESYFYKSKDAIHTAVKRMNKQTGNVYRTIKEGKVIIKDEGVKWLVENYFRRAYLKDLELYKLELQKHKVKLYGNSN